MVPPKRRQQPGRYAPLISELLGNNRGGDIRGTAKKLKNIV
jgi:hypothetical protein